MFLYLVQVNARISLRNQRPTSRRDSIIRYFPDTTMKPFLLQKCNSIKQNHIFADRLNGGLKPHQDLDQPTIIFAFVPFFTHKGQKTGVRYANPFPSHQFMRLG